MVELVYTLHSGCRVWRFESSRGHHIKIHCDEVRLRGLEHKVDASCEIAEQGIGPLAVYFNMVFNQNGEFSVVRAKVRYSQSKQYSICFISATKYLVLQTLGKTINAVEQRGAEGN